LAVTIPGTFSGVWPTYGDVWVAPWISWMKVSGGGGVVVVKLKTWSAVIVSGGSFVSWSDTCPATTVTVQVSP
jgi:hypothetical protein